MIKPIEEIKEVKPKKMPSGFRILSLVVFVTMGLLLNKIFIKKYENVPMVLPKFNVTNNIQENNLVKSSLSKAQGLGGNVLGAATEFAEKLASDTGSFISKTVYNNTFKKLVDQIGKLPKDQQEKIREQICK